MSQGSCRGGSRRRQLGAMSPASAEAARRHRCRRGPIGSIRTGLRRAPRTVDLTQTHRRVTAWHHAKHRRVLPDLAPDERSGRSARGRSGSGCHARRCSWVRTHPWSTRRRHRWSRTNVWPEDSRRWQLDIASRLVATAAGQIVAVHHDMDVTRELPWSRRPEASRLVKDAADPGRGGRRW